MESVTGLLRLAKEKPQQHLSLVYCASFSLALRGKKVGGILVERLDYSNVPLPCDPAAAQRLGARLAETVRFLEEEIGTPQDVEGVVTGDQIHIVQTRPQQGKFREHALE